MRWRLLNISYISYYITGNQRRAGYTPWWTRWRRGLLWHASLTPEPHSALPSWLTPSLTARCSANSCSVRRRLLVHVLVQFSTSKNSTVLKLFEGTFSKMATITEPGFSHFFYCSFCRCSFPWPAPAVLPHWAHVCSPSAPGHAAGPERRAADPETGPGTTVDPSPSPPLPHTGRVLQVQTVTFDAAEIL